MAPSKAGAAAAPFEKEERVLCFHHDMLYEAKILDSRPTENGQSFQYRIHYKGWKNTWDDWVPQDRVRKFTEDNKELAAQLHQQMKALQQKAPKSASKRGGRANGSDFSSARGSEERHVAAQGGRGPRRNRDYDLEPAYTSLVEGESYKHQGAATQLSAANVNNNGLPAGDGLPSQDSAKGRPKTYGWNVTAPDHLFKSPPENYTYNTTRGTLRDPYKYGKIAEAEQAARDRRAEQTVEDISDELPNVNHDTEETFERGTGWTAEPLYFSNVLDAHIGLFAELVRLEVLYLDYFHFDSDAAFERLLTQIQEQEFHSRPSIKIPLPDHIKAILVDDWENVTKNQQLVPLPHHTPISVILKAYRDSESPKRQAGSASADILEEFVAGLKEYFNRSLGRLLLYRFERAQYLEVFDLWASDKPEFAGKTPSDTYGAEHLCRLIVSLPELIAQTNMDQQSVNRLREEVTKLTNFISRNATKYFVSEYETPSQDYIDQARS